MKTLNDEEVVDQQEATEPEMEVEGQEQDATDEGQDNEGPDGEEPEEDLSAEEGSEQSARWSHEMLRQDSEERFMRGEGGRLSRELYEKYEELTAYMQSDALVRNQAACTQTVEMNFYRRLRENLAKAQLAERCGKLLQNGRLCGSPKMKGSEYCYAHTRLQAARPRMLGFPALDGPLGLQESISLGLRALLEGKIDLRMAGMIGYYLQLALWNSGRLEIGEESGDH